MSLYLYFRYDPGFQIWGMENIEMSARTWMCGDSVVFHPCSHVGHYYRPTRENPQERWMTPHFVYKNAIRFAEVPFSSPPLYIFLSFLPSLFVFFFSFFVKLLTILYVLYMKVWMDEYKEDYFASIQWSREQIEEVTSVPDLEDRRQLRKALDCKSFGWYLENVVQRIMKKYNVHIADEPPT